MARSLGQFHVTVNAIARPLLDWLVVPLSAADLRKRCIVDLDEIIGICGPLGIAACQ